MEPRPAAPDTLACPLGSRNHAGMNRRAFLLLALLCALVFPSLASAAGSFDGVWSSDFGRMRLVVQGSSVEGRYQYVGRATIKGTLRGSLLSFTYAEPGGVTGSGTFVLQPDGNSFTGMWRQDDGKLGGTWQGRRLLPTAHVAYLLVLEVHWEPSADDPDFSFGAMLKQYFTRVPTIQVRHRFIDSVDDVEKWGGDLAFVPEPVFVYFSSHGDDKGLAAPGALIDGETIGRALSWTPNLKLVHFGACGFMGGDQPQRLRRALKQSVPISGYTLTADWGASAAIDFFYLDLMLARGIDPVQAAGEVGRSILFSSATPVAGSAIKPTGFRLLAP